MKYPDPLFLLSSFQIKIWEPHIFFDLLSKEESLIDCAGVMIDLGSCLSLSSAFNLIYFLLLIIEH
jgi:hypothetical protein